MDQGITYPKEQGRNDRRKKRKPAFDPTQLQQFYWVFELEGDGTVVYARPRSIETANEIEGRNFFDEGLGFEDISKCRHHFLSFIKSNKAAARFTWRCSGAGRDTNANVHMTRAYQTGSDARTGVVMMEIRG